MKIILTLILLCFGFTTSNAQLLSKFTAKEAYDFAFNEVLENLSDPALRGIGTITTRINIGFPVDLEFNMETGEATTWVYEFVNKLDTTESQTVVVTSLLGNFQNSTELVGDAVDAFKAFIPSSFMTTGSWNDSGVMGNTILASSEYTSLLQTYPQAEVKLVGLGNNEDIGTIEYGIPLWVVNFGSNPDNLEDIQFICTSDAINGDVNCFDVTTSIIELEDNVNFQIYPQPSSNILNINFPSDMKGEKRLKIYNTLSNKVAEYTLNETHFVMLLNSYAPGVYFAEVTHNNKSYQFKFIVN